MKISMYGQTIREAIATGGRIDRTDDATVNLVEELLRGESGGVLDHRSKRWLVSNSRSMLAEIESAPSIAREICEGYQIPVPAWA